MEYEVNVNMLSHEEQAINDKKQFEAFLKTNELRKALKDMMTTTQRFQDSLESEQLLDMLINFLKPESLSFKQFLALYKLYLQDGTEFFESFQEFFDDLWASWQKVQELVKNKD